MSWNSSRCSFKTWSVTVLRSFSDETTRGEAWAPDYYSRVMEELDCYYVSYHGMVRSTYSGAKATYDLAIVREMSHLTASPYLMDRKPYLRASTIGCNPTQWPTTEGPTIVVRFIGA